MKSTRSAILSLAVLSLLSFSTARAASYREFSSGLRSLEADEFRLISRPYAPAPLPDLVVPADTFQISIAGFNAGGTGVFLVAPITATFGLTQTFAGGPGGQTVTVMSSETFSGGNTIDSVTISVPMNFVPTGTTIGGTPVTTLQLDMGRLNAGTNGFDLVTPIPSATGTGSIQFSGGTLALNPTVALTNGGMTLAGSEGVNAGGADLSTFAINSFTLTFTYATVPEPSTWMLLGVGLVFAAFSMWRRRVEAR